MASNNHQRQDNNKHSNRKKNFSNDKLNGGNNDLNEDGEHAIIPHGPSNTYTNISNNEDNTHPNESFAITSVHDESNKRFNKRSNNNKKKKYQNDRSNDMNDDRNRAATAIVPHEPSQSYRNTSNNEGNSQLNESLVVTATRDEFKQHAVTFNISNNRDDSQSTSAMVRDEDHIIAAPHDSNYSNHDDFQSNESKTTTVRDRENVAITLSGSSKIYPSALNNEDDGPQSTNTPVRNESNNKRSNRRTKRPSDGSNNLNEDRDHNAIASNDSLNTYSNEDDSNSRKARSLRKDVALSKLQEQVPVDLQKNQEDRIQPDNMNESENTMILQHSDNENSNPQFSENNINQDDQDANFNENMDGIDKAKFSKQVKYDVTQKVKVLPSIHDNDQKRQSNESQKRCSDQSDSLQSERSVQQEIIDLSTEHKDLECDDSIKSNKSVSEQNMQQNSDQGGQSTSKSTNITNFVEKIIDKVIPKDSIVIVFYVHMPKINDIGFPYVVGNIPELGEWNDKATIKLTEKKISGKPTSCWESKPIRIPLAQFENKVIQYKYAVREKGKKNKNKALIYEGGDNRVLEVDGGDKYEIWAEKENSKIYFPPEIKDVYLVKIIYDSVTSENLKEKIMRYEKIMKIYPKSTKAATSIEFIMNSFLEDKSLEKRLFLCVLLGYYVKGQDSQYSSLPFKFQSSLVFDTFQNINSETFPSDTYKILALTIPLLVRHSFLFDSDSLDWLKIFGVASFIDPKYEFINYVSDLGYNEKMMHDFLKRFNDLAKPIICTIDDKELYAKIAEWLLRQCSTIKLLVTVWQDIINHNDEIDELLQPKLIERVRYILSRSASCLYLYTCYCDLPEQLKIMLTGIFRQQSLRILSARQQNPKWEKEHLDAIFNLLTSDKLQWPLEKYFDVLDTVSQSMDLGLLTRFHELLKFGFKIFDKIDEQKEQKKKLSLLCNQWYRNLLERASSISNSNADLKNKFAFMAFNHISKVYPYIGKIPVWKDLLEIVVNRVKPTSENIILSHVNQVAQKLEAPVIEAFIVMVKDKLNSSILCTDNQLMTKIKLICACSIDSTDELKVPTSFSEDVLCHIMTRLQTSFASQNFSDNFHLSLLKFGEFWIQLLKATGSVDKLHSHPQINEVRNAISHLAENLIEESINIYLLQELLKKDDDFLLTYFGFAIMREGLSSINKDILTNIREKYRIYELGLDHLNSFYTEFCPQSIVFDVKEYIDDIYEIHQRKKDITLRETSLTNYWGIHTDILGIAENLYKYRKSQTFKNFLNISLNDLINYDEFDEVDEQNVKWIVKIMPDLAKSYCQWCGSYSQWESQKFSHAKILWDGVPDINVELDLMSNILKVEKSPKLIRTLTDISKVSQWIDKLHQLTVVVLIFKLQIDEDENWLQATLNDLRDDETLTLGKLSNSFDLLHERLKMFDDACWALIKELSIAGEFLEWIRSIADHDIKNLINGVDDHSDERLIQEDTVSSLIQVKQFLLPIMINAEVFSLEEFLNEIQNVTATNSSLASKITLCNCNNMALQNMYAAISNRGEVTKEKIYIGVYEFKWALKDDTCSATLSYSSKNGVKMTYTMNDLQDLRGRALLIAKPASTMYTEDEEESKDIMNEFVLQVDKAQSIIDESTKLIEAGHFNYRSYKREVKGLEQLITHLKNLEKDLKAWESTVSKVQQEHYYLTFFPARHILSFYDYFSNSKGSNRRICERTCETLVRFVNFGAKLPSMRNPKDALNIKNNHYKILCEIGTRLKGIFESLPKEPIPFEDCGERVVSDVVHHGKLFVAACSDRSVIPNIIMSLYANSKFYPNAWQLLICTSSTTSEEIAIFIKRCSYASNNGYNDHLFCMANLEVLDYKLQYYVVKQIRSLLDKAKNFYLALICCQESGMHHHILDQFSEYVRVTNGLSAKSMKESYRGICQKVVCVTSDLSGQGKTEWVKQESYRKKFIPRTFIINDGADFGKLVRQFQKFPIRKDLDSLHINIISADNPWEVNMFLFHLLTFGIVSHQSDIATLPDIHIYIEVASSTDSRLVKSLPIVSYLDTPHLRFNLKKLIISNEICSPIQVVCQYLNAHEVALLDENEIGYRPPTQKPLPSKRCQQLLSKYFFDTITADLASYRFLEIFINVFANQLNLRLMIKENNIRTTLFNTLMEVSKDFATRSIQTKSSQKQALSDSPDQLENITSWDDSNHLLVFFMSQTPDSICALYRDKTKVPENVQTLLKSQHISGIYRNQWQLEDYRTIPMDLLLQRLEGLARKTQHQINYPPYALSADNLLKMALILLRTRANVPVVICGEAGLVEAEFHALNLHAGITEEMINQFMEDSQKNVDKHDVWLFFDEINTCNHIGLLSDLIAHRVHKGNQMVHPNVKIFAACNPYRIRTKSSSVAGLQIKRFDEQRSNLVYEVKPLPDQILDYVWDYGVLEPSDERKYIEIMTKTQLDGNLYHDILPDLLFTSQQFIRDVEEKYTVSLRDVKRAITLIKFFYDSLQNRPRVNKNLPYPPAKPDIILRSYILGLGLCYQSRLYEQKQRTAYRTEMCKIFLKNKFQIREELFKEVIKKEQEDYVNRMTLPFNTAKNDALLENVLVMIVCILTKIPVFIIGAPGSSKSLAIRLISQNLLFEKAKKFQDTSSDDFPVVSVVLLDEVGLAETSPHNPLKVLHSLLEPSYPAEGPTVSVVGISNWRLDNSKSSRALLVQRPQLTLEDLVEIAVRLLNDQSTTKVQPSSVRHLATAYIDYEKSDQEIPNFHGLRDYYSLVKSLSDQELTPKNIQMALARNFGGTNNNSEICEKYFGNVINIFNSNQSWTYEPISTEVLINANLEDEFARHLMVIGNSDSIVNLLVYQLRQRNLEPVVIFGSQFPKDQNDQGSDYSYTVLSRIMMCVEAGRPLILTDLDIIYGSLYDLWNQNYIVVGSKEDPKYYTRVALGAYANPMLSVSKNFRCILVMDESKVKDADPPLLNRFEKQRMTMSDTFTSDHEELVEELSSWANRMSTITSTQFAISQDTFTLNDLFIGFNHDETIQSLVVDIKETYYEMDNSEILEKCKECLIAVASSDGIVRAEKSALEPEEIEHCKKVYFKDQHHDHLEDYFSSLLVTDETTEGHQIIINTFSNINTDIAKCLKDLLNCQVLKLSTFKTEAEFQNQIKRFWFDSPNKELLVLQCDLTTANAGCIKLAKFLIEQYRLEYLTKMKQQAQESQEQETFIVKHVCIMLHIHRDNQVRWKGFNFMCKWKQVTIETLVRQEKPLSSLLYGNLCDIIEETYPFEEILKQELLWCLLCIKYPSTLRGVNHLKYITEKIPKIPELVDALKTRTKEWVEQEDSLTDWQYHVASSKKSLYPHSSFVSALLTHVREMIRKPLAKLLCALERFSAIETFISLNRLKDEQQEQLATFWKEMFADKDVISIESIPPPKPDAYSLPGGVHDLKFPFSYYFMKQIDRFKRLYEEEIAKLREDSENLNDDGTLLSDDVIEDYNKGFANNIYNSVNHLKSSPLEWNRELYFDDFVSVICSNEPGYKKTNKTQIMSLIFKWLLGPEKVLNPILLHIFWWNNSSSVLVKFQLAQMCSKVNNMKDPEDHHFEKFLVYEIAEQKLYELESIDINQLPEWQHESNKIISLCTKLPEASDTEPFHLLQICSDLISTETIPLDSVKQIVKVAYPDGVQEIFTSKFIKTVFQILNEVKDYVPRKLFIIKCLDVLPLTSNIRLDLYNNLFSKELFPLMSIIIYKIFQQEDEENRDIFFQLLKMPKRVRTISPRLNAINKCLSNHGLGSFMATLCCDVLQKSFFSNCTLEYSAEYFQDAIGALLRPETGLSTLHRITSIAFLKEFVHRFWEYTNSDNNVSNAIEINNSQLEDTDISELTGRLNDNMEVNKQTTFAPLYNFNNKGPFEKNFFAKFKKKSSNMSHLSLMGLIFSRLHAIRTSRQWTENETSIASMLQEKIESVDHLPTIYKITIKSLISNEHMLLRLTEAVNNQDLMIKSAIGHIISLHASIRHDSSPLANLLQNLHYCNGLFIPATPSDETSIVLSAVLQRGFSNGTGTCPECGRRIGGENHVAAEGQMKLDSNPLRVSLNAKNQSGYIGEPINQEPAQSVRMLSPVSYRILHLFIHVIIGAWAHAPLALAFLRKNNHTATDAARVIKYVDDKYADLLTSDLEKIISDALDFDITDDMDSEESNLQQMDDDNVIVEENKENKKKVKKIPAEVFAGAIKRFILRFLLKELIKEDHPMSVYFTDYSLNLWPAQISEELIDEFFPLSLMVCHAFEAYRFVSEKIEGMKQLMSQNQNTSKRFQRNRNQKQRDQNASHQNFGPENGSSSNTSSNRGSYSSRGGRGFNKGRNNASRGQNQGGSNASGGNGHSENAESSKRGRGNNNNNNRRRSKSHNFNKNDVL
ncbi:963_t:CDS:10 [Gigaspora margarita]|uniref:963_t:CDS:1 n=1 Tax=Gigaspora margarita TaxID=4874 RepID=A0ABM8VYI7_GIGMA|nr:963_t:CDS:10 [Gigaspora margarita]